MNTCMCFCMHIERNLLIFISAKTFRTKSLESIGKYMMLGSVGGSRITLDIVH
jgi:hypothetical protein